MQFKIQTDDVRLWPVSMRTTCLHTKVVRCASVKVVHERLGGWTLHRHGLPFVRLLQELLVPSEQYQIL